MVGYEDRSCVLVLAAPTPQEAGGQVRHKVQDAPLVPRAVAAPEPRPEEVQQMPRHL